AAPVAAWTSGEQTTTAAPTSTTTQSVESMTDAAGATLTSAEINAAVQEFLTKLMADIQQLLAQLQAVAPTATSTPAVTDTSSTAPAGTSTMSTKTDTDEAAEATDP